MSTALTLAAAPSLPALLTTLPTGLSEAAVAHLADECPVRELPLAELVPLVGDLLNGAALLMGYRNALAELDDLDLMANGVAGMIQRRFGSFKPAELSQAFQRGASGEYLTDPKEPHQVALHCVAKWLEAYQARARAAVVQALQKQAAQPQLALPAPKIDYVGSVLDYVALAKAGELPTGFDLDLGNVLYTWLKETGALTGFRTGEQYAAMQAEETERLLTRTIPAKGAERREYTSFVNALAADGDLPDAHPLSRSVVNACKKRVLREWLLYVAELELELAEFLADPLTRCLCYRAWPGQVCPDCQDTGTKQAPEPTPRPEPPRIFPPACPKCCQRPDRCICRP